MKTSDQSYADRITRACFIALWVWITLALILAAAAQIWGADFFVLYWFD